MRGKNEKVIHKQKVSSILASLYVGLSYRPEEWFSLLFKSRNFIFVLKFSDCLSVETYSNFRTALGRLFCEIRVQLWPYYHYHVFTTVY